MYKSTYVSLEAMRAHAPDLSIIEGEDMFYTDLTVFTSHEIRLGWPKNIIMLRPGVLAPPIPVYHDLFDIILADLIPEYAGSFIELTPLRLDSYVNQYYTFHCGDDHELTNFLIKIHWPAPTPPIDDARFQELCQRRHATTNARVLPGDFNPCGTDYLIVPIYTLEHNGQIRDYIGKQSTAELYAVDRAWRKYDAEAPYYKARITKLIESSVDLDRVFCVTDEYVLHRSKEYTRNLDLHCRLWYNNDTLQKLTSIASGEYRLLSQLFGNLY